MTGAGDDGPSPAAARVRTGSVRPAVAAHLAHNTVIVVVVFAAAF